MARVIPLEPGITEAVGKGIRGFGVNTQSGGTLNPFSYGTPCYWAWHGANAARLYYATPPAKEASRGT